MARRSKRGFTLVEMMIVVLIIGILVTIALPNFLRARETSRATACAANMKQIQGAIETWAMTTKAPANTATSSFPTPAQLATQGYLKAEPLCPSGGLYNYTGSNLTDYDVRCNVHGTLTNAMGSL